MPPNDFIDLLRQKPFEPFRVHLNSGEVFEVRHSENAAVRLSVVWLYTPAKDYPIPLAESKVVVTLRNIAFVDVLPRVMAPGQTQN
jgi:hypothetical protein